MADISTFYVKNGGSAALATNTLTAGAASQTVPHMGKDQRLALRVANGNATTDAVVCVKSADGPRGALPDMKVTVEAGHTAYIALFDTARYKDLADGKITVDLTGPEDAVLPAEELAAVKLEAVQL
jgi:hypothetical protein